MITLSIYFLKLNKMNKLFLHLIMLVCILSFYSCTGQDDIISTPIQSEKYEPCCGTPSEVIRELAPGIKIFIPNAFTPNSDGVNDLFYPVVDTTIIPNGSIIRFAIYDSADDKVKRIIHSVPGGFLYTDIQGYAFNGRYYNESNLKWETWRGQFWYDIIVSVDGEGYWKLKGSACSIVCDDEAAIFKSKEGCFFPIQADSRGNYISTIPPGEDACFGK